MFCHCTPSVRGQTMIEAEIKLKEVIEWLLIDNAQIRLPHYDHRSDGIATPITPIRTVVLFRHLCRCWSVAIKAEDLFTSIRFCSGFSEMTPTRLNRATGNYRAFHRQKC